MSVTFLSNAPGDKIRKTEPCLCTQMCGAFSAMMRGEDSPEIRASLRAEANPHCYMCHGEGVEVVTTSTAPELNLCNDNAKRLLAALGLDDIYGEISLPEARRAIIRAKNTNLEDLVRNEVVEYGTPRDNYDGTVEMRPLRYHSAPLTLEGLQERIERFAAFVEDSAKLGATQIYWG